MRTEDELVKRLHAIANMDLRTGPFLAHTFDTAAEAADKIPRLSAEIKRLTAALERTRQQSEKFEGLYEEYLARCEQAEEYAASEAKTGEDVYEHLGDVLYFLCDLHPDDRCEALDKALAFYNAARPDKKIEPSGFPFRHLTTLGDYLESLVAPAHPSRDAEQEPPGCPTPGACSCPALKEARRLVEQADAVTHTDAAGNQHRKVFARDLDALAAAIKHSTPPARDYVLEEAAKAIERVDNTLLHQDKLAAHIRALKKSQPGEG